MKKKFNLASLLALSIITSCAGGVTNNLNSKISIKSNTNKIPSANPIIDNNKNVELPNGTKENSIELPVIDSDTNKKKNTF